MLKSTFSPRGILSSMVMLAGLVLALSLSTPAKSAGLTGADTGYKIDSTYVSPAPMLVLDINLAIVVDPGDENDNTGSGDVTGDANGDGTDAEPANGFGATQWGTVFVQGQSVRWQHTNYSSSGTGYGKVGERRYNSTRIGDTTQYRFQDGARISCSTVNGISSCR